MPVRQIPDGWRAAKLDELGEVNRGRSRHRPRYASHLYGGPYPFIQTGDIKVSCGRITSFQQTYSDAGLAQSRLWPTGTLCITIAANIAETGILTFPACFPDSVVGFIADDTKCNVSFIEYLFRFLRKGIQDEASGTVQDNINLDTLKRLEIPLPPLPTQHAIARILRSLDNKIELNRQMNETLEAMARAIFKSWFLDFDPVRAKVDGRDTGLPAEIAALFPDGFETIDGREVPRGWGVKPLDQIATFLNGLALQNYPPGGEDYLPVIKISQLRKGDTEGSDKASVDISSEYIIDDGDILFSWSGSLEVVIWCGGKGALNQHLFKITSDKCPKWFYYLWVLHHLPEFRLIAEGKATTMGHIQRHHLSEAMVLVPPDKQMQAMNKIMEQLIYKIISNTTESRTLAQIRDALLPKLMNGEIELKG